MGEDYFADENFEFVSWKKKDDKSLSDLAFHYIEDQSILDDNFKLTMKHKECGNVIGLVKGGLTRKPRMNCFQCDEMVNPEDVLIDIVENQS